MRIGLVGEFIYNCLNIRIIEIGWQIIAALHLYAHASEVCPIGTNMINAKENAINDHILNVTKLLV